MKNILSLLGLRIPRSIRRQGEAAIADYLVDGSGPEIIEAYDAARAAGLSEHEAALAGARRLITHKL